MSERQAELDLETETEIETDSDFDENDGPVRGILVVGPSWVGDMVMAQSLFKLLKRAEPNCIIDVLAPAWSLPILERMPEVRRGVVMPVGHGKLEFGVRWNLGRELGQIGYSQAIVLPNSLKSALVPFFAAKCAIG